MMKDDGEQDDGGKFAAFLGGFGSHANTEKRAKAERAASMRVDDGRRGDGKRRIHQYNGKVTADVLALARACHQALECGPARILEEGITLVSEKYGVKVQV